MRKKLLTVALAAVMVLGSAFSAFAVDSPNTNSPELDNDSPNASEIEVEADEAISEDTVAKVQAEAKVEGLANATIKVSVVSKKDFEAAKKAGTTVLADKKFEVAEIDLFNGATQLTQLENSVKVTIPVFESIKNAAYVAVYRLDGNKLTSLGVVEVKDGKITFETDHFSTYVFAEAEAPSTTPEEQPQTGDTAPFVPAIIIASIAALVFGVAVFARKKES